MKQKLQQEVKAYIKKYGDDIFFGEELNFIASRLQSIESSIAVVGQFSVGKSALLNALLGEELLATRKVESTKILTRIRHCTSANEAKVVLTFKDGHQSTLALKNVQELQKYTTFQGEEITDSLQFVDVYWPVQFLNKELVLIDTPGANSLTASAFQTTRQQLKSSSAIIYLFMGTKGLDQEDYDIIKEYTEQKKKVFLVGTHIDNLTTEQWQEVEQEVHKKIAQMDGLQEVEIVGISSAEALAGKQQQNTVLLQQSNLPALEKMLHTYMTTKEYENAEIRSIEHDFLVLLNEIKSLEQQQSEQYKVAEQDRLRRLERLTVIIELEYTEVEAYGLELLKQRNHFISELNNQYEDQLLTNGNDILKAVRQHFQQFQLYIQQQMTTLPKVDVLKAAYAKHLNEIEHIYTQWDDKLNGYAQSFIQNIELHVQQQDIEFMDMLKKLETNVKVRWDEFDLILQKIQLKPLTFTADLKDFEQYDSNVAEAEKKHKQLKSLLISKQQEYERIRLSKIHEERVVGSRQQKEQSKLGSKPSPRAQYRTKGMWFWKSEELVGYDYSEQERWDKQMKEIHTRYRSLLRDIEQNNMRQVNANLDHTRNLEEQLDELEDAEQTYNVELLGALYSTVSNQSEIVKKIHSERVNNMKDEWKLLVTTQEERNYRHIQTIEENYKKFVRKSKQQAIAAVKVL